MAQWVRELTALPGPEFISFPSTHMATHNQLCNPVSGDLALRHGIQVVHSHTCRQSTHTHKIKINEGKKNLIYKNQ